MVDSVHISFRSIKCSKLGLLLKAHVENSFILKTLCAPQKTCIEICQMQSANKYFCLLTYIPCRILICLANFEFSVRKVVKCTWFRRAPWKNHFWKKSLMFLVFPLNMDFLKVVKPFYSFNSFKDNFSEFLLRLCYLFAKLSHTVKFGIIFLKVNEDIPICFPNLVFKCLLVSL